MKHISTSALAQEHGISSKELFQQLSEKGWIYKKDDKWQLTKTGQMVGGEMNYNPKYGEYIVWPQNLDLNKDVNAEDTLSSTKIGEHFGISAQKVNLILAELGWIEKSEIGGWYVTKQGIKNGGYEMISQDGIPYVIWDKTILKNKSVSFTGSKTIEKVSGNNEYGDDFRNKYPRNIRTQDGHYVRSKGEAIIDNYLYNHRIVHAYERLVPIEEKMYSDFYIPEGRVYIEYWGLEDDANYEKRKKEKQELYAKNDLQLIELRESDIERIDDTLPRLLRAYKINID